jgi:uridine kinase
MVPEGRYSGWMDKLRTLPRKQTTLLIGIDGCGGAGKSALAQALAQGDPEVTIVSMDDFFRPSSQARPPGSAIGAEYDWPRLRGQVLEPLRRNEPGRYQRYDWGSDALAEWHTVPVGGVVIVEGIYSTRDELRDAYDYTIWVDSPRALRLQRGLARDGEQARLVWTTRWMPAEDRYVAEQHPEAKADTVVPGYESADTLDPHLA